MALGANSLCSIMTSTERRVAAHLARFQQFLTTLPEDCDFPLPVVLPSAVSARAARHSGFVAAASTGRDLCFCVMSAISPKAIF
jgi:hypothetical protein